MQKTKDMRDSLIREFTENYMEKLFYFCLKKTGDQTEAEDLTQDIALQIVISLTYDLFFELVEISGIEPLTSCLQGRRSPS